MRCHGVDEELTTRLQHVVQEEHLCDRYDVKDRVFVKRKRPCVEGNIEHTRTSVPKYIIEITELFCLLQMHRVLFFFFFFIWFQQNQIKVKGDVEGSPE